MSDAVPAEASSPESPPVRHAAPAHSKVLAQTALVLSVVGITIAGCIAVLVTLVPDSTGVLGSLKSWPYAVAGAVALICGIVAVVLGAVAWRSSRKRSLKTSTAVSGFLLGLVAVAAALALAAIDVVVYLR